MAETIVIIGASSDRRKFGNKAVRAYRELGWTVYPVHPKETEIEGLQVFRSIRDVPRPIQRVSLYVLPIVGMTLLDDIAAAKPEEVFFNPGSESPELVEKALAMGLNAAVACSIVDVGMTPGRFGAE
ncbi:MAG TPA: CoA-binding protein [Acidobacteriota bacterium]|nr:CoA-binding protein [Acidobacteriota bacterium]